MKLFKAVLILILLSGFGSLTVAADREYGELHQLENVIQSGLGYDEVVVDSYTAENKTFAKIVRLFPVLSTINPSQSEVLRLRLSKLIANHKSSTRSDDQLTPVQLSSDDVSTLTAKAFVIYDPVDKTVLLQKNMNQVRSIASISKLFTAMVALDALPFDQKFILSSSAKTLGSASGMSIGTRFDLSTAITYLLIRSSNDIANQIALTHDALYGYAGKTFASKMTNKARVIGLNNTAFSGPSGLENDNVSTAYELALTIDYMRENYPELLSLARQRYVERGGKSLESSNPVRSQSGWLGGKNGYITKSGRTTASLFTVNDKEVIVVHLGSVIDDDGHDNQALLQLVK